MKYILLLILSITSNYLIWKPDYGMSEIIEYDYLEYLPKERVNVFKDGKIIANLDKNCIIEI